MRWMIEQQLMLMVNKAVVNINWCSVWGRDVLQYKYICLRASGGKDYSTKKFIYAAHS
jgi:hypothetical protein